MKKIMVVMLILSLTLVGICGCGNNDGSSGTIKMIDGNTPLSVDAVKVNEIVLEKHVENEEDIYFNVFVNVTNQLGYDCDDISVKLKLLDENNDIIDNIEPFINCIDSEQSGNAEVTVNDTELLEKLKAVEVCGYSAWEKDKNEGVEGKYSDKQIFDIENITIRTIK